VKTPLQEFFYWLTTAHYSLDVVQNFNTGFYVEDEVYETNRCEIFKNYMSFWFWVDVAATIPY